MSNPRALPDALPEEWIDATGPVESGKLPPGVWQSLLAGYCAFTTFRWPLSEARLTRHVTRLIAHGDAMGITAPALATPHIRNTLTDLAQRQGEAISLAFRLTLAPDASQAGALWQGGGPWPARLLISLRSISGRQRAPLNEHAQGASLQIVGYEKAFPALKHGALAEAMLLRQSARRAGFDDALWRNQRGLLSESSVANVFWIRDGALWTPDPQGDGCLAGITRAEVLQIATANGVEVVEQALATDDLRTVSGGFLTNAVQGLWPIARAQETVMPWPPAARALLTGLQAEYNALDSLSSS
ncbi:MAG: aminotransferase class IV [Vampirovibrionales bacterium]|nr:aminotransferase class IV [Vampirovibrionales bacterium]